MTCSVLGYMTAYLLVRVSAPVFLHRLGEGTPRTTCAAAASAVLVVGCFVSYVDPRLESAPGPVWAC